MIDSSFIEKIEDMVQPRVEYVLDVPVSKERMSVIMPPSPAPLEVSSLTGVIAYCKEQMEVGANLVLHVVSPKCVWVLGVLDGTFRTREKHLCANAMVNEFDFGIDYGVDKFIIAIQSQFVQSETTAAILQLVGNLTTTHEVATMDDGVTQVVEVRTGVIKKASCAVPNPVRLAPYRTFGEIEQPTSGFVLRVNTSQKCSLHEADGGKWRIEAMQSIKAYLSEHIQLLDLQDRVTILA